MHWREWNCCISMWKCEPIRQLNNWSDYLEDSFRIIPSFPSIYIFPFPCVFVFQQRTRITFFPLPHRIYIKYYKSWQNENTLNASTLHKPSFPIWCDHGVDAVVARVDCLCWCVCVWQHSSLFQSVCRKQHKHTHTHTKLWNYDNFPY